MEKVTVDKALDALKDSGLRSLGVIGGSMGMRYATNQTMVKLNPFLVSLIGIGLGAAGTLLLKKDSEFQKISEGVFGAGLLDIAGKGLAKANIEALKPFTEAIPALSGNDYEHTGFQHRKLAVSGMAGLYDRLRGAENIEEAKVVSVNTKLR